MALDPGGAKLAHSLGVLVDADRTTGDGLDLFEETAVTTPDVDHGPARLEELLRPIELPPAVLVIGVARQQLVEARIPLVVRREVLESAGRALVQHRVTRRREPRA